MTTTIAKTLNPRYDAVRAKWAEGGHDSSPECENCCADLAGKAVYEGSMWYGDCCAEEVAQDDADYEANRAAERRMGY